MDASSIPTVAHQSESTWWFSYWRHPVFTWPWFIKRSGLFCVIALLNTLLSVISYGTLTNDWWLAVTAGGILLAVFLFKIMIGSALATTLRERHWSANIERVAIVTAVLLGTWLCTVVQGRWLTYQVEHVFSALAKGGWIGSAVMVRDKPRVVILYTRITNISLHFFLCGGFALRSYFTKQRRAEQARQQREIVKLKLAKHESDLQLAVLQAQIEPHFLFNTLASVRSLVTQDHARAAAMVDALAAYLRVILPKLRTPDAPATLGEQLDICASYLQLMRLRMGDRLSFSIELPDSLREIAVPPLLLLPLVENAVTHGIEPKPHDGTIHISVRQQETDAGALLWIEVRDDGVGLGAGSLTRDVGKGVGLANIRSQLSLRYGTQASLEVSSRAGGGTSAVLMIPS